MDNTSSLRKAVYGVPQGSIWGPLLFLLYIYIYIYISSIKHPRGKLVLFADNTNTIVADKNENAVQQKMFYAMEELVLWFPKNDLIINIEKTVVMFFHSNQTS